MMNSSQTGFRIADLNLGPPKSDCCYEFDYNGLHFEVQRFGTNYSVPYMKELITTLHNQVDAFAISHMPPVMRIRDRAYAHRDSLEILATPSSIPICNGAQLKELATVNAMLEAIAAEDIVPSRGIFFPLGLLHLELIYALNKYSEHIACGDSYSVFGIPWLAKPGAMTALVAKTFLTLVNLRPVKNQTPEARSIFKRQTKAALLQQAKKYQYILSDVGPLILFGEDLGFIQGKDIIITENHHLESELYRYHPRSVTNLFPKKFQLNRHLNYSVLDAALRLAHNKTAPLSLEEWQNLLEVSLVTKEYTRRHILGARPATSFRTTAYLLKKKRELTKEKAPDFAFIVHPLSQNDFYKAKPLKPLMNLPKGFRDGVEKVAAKTPGFVYGHINHILSQKNNREVNGVIYGLMTTPKMMFKETPESIYEKIERICYHAADMGAKIIGLGAYTKIIGDSGETINRNSPIPVTTGNSLSASATLWALRDITMKMGILKIDKESGLMDATATVIGATGSIGSVSAKLLSLAFNKLCLVAPRLDRLEQLAAEIRKINPRCQVTVALDGNEVAAHSDVLVTATSAYDRKLIDVELLKPGSVICDCSRPLDFDAQDAIKRPDILIIESGEVVLPGPVKMSCDIGLPDNSVYACLGETALLAMEGTYEPFTLGRNIDWVKVKQIYKMAQEHGVKLAAIQGCNGFISDKEIALTRELALSKLR